MKTLSSSFAPVQTDSIVDRDGRSIHVGDLVVNFDCTARVVEIKNATTLVVRGVGIDTKTPTWGKKWLANPALCLREG